jgi:uncharacterized protein (DUF1501 family)
MLTLRAAGPRLCDGLMRRDVIRAGGLAAFGLSLPHLLRAEAAGADSPGGRAKSCIILFLMGGPPQHSTWDPKPEAPPEVRGEIGPIATSVPGLMFGELMPRLATQAHKLAVLRAMHTGDNAHSSSGYYMLTGRPHDPMNAENVNPGPPNDWPFIGAMVQKLTPERPVFASVRLPMRIFNTDGSIWPGQDAGFLGRSADPWLLRCDPASPDYSVPEFSLPVEISADRLISRQHLLKHVGHDLDAVRRSSALDRYDYHTQRAFDLLASPDGRKAFDLAAEPAETRERYGMSQFGQSVLLGRRLIEAGVRLVHVNWHRGPDEPNIAPCWDSHAGEAQRLKTVLIPPFDLAFSALLEDLEARGLLDETLVVAMAEFGRTPKFNANAGRDHWGPVFSIALAGAGIKGGAVHGASDRLGAYPASGLVRPEDLSATIFHLLGHAPETFLTDPQGRVFPISHGRVIEEILA